MSVRGLIIAVFVLFCVCPHPIAVHAEDVYMPTERHYHALTVGRDCAIFRALSMETKMQISHHKEVMSSHIESLKQARRALVACATEKGITNIESGDQEVLMAELCPSLYRSWLTPSYRVRMVNQDLHEAYKTSKLTDYYIQLRCKNVPVAESRPASVEEEDVDKETDEDNVFPPQSTDIEDLYEPGDGFEFVEIARKGLGIFNPQ